MKTTSLIVPKVRRKSLTTRIDPSIRNEAEKIAVSHGVSLGYLVETGLKLVIKQVQNEKPKA